jgi:hypothetical protein
LFRHGELDVHGAFVSVAHQRTQPLDIDQTTWRKARKRRIISEKRHNNRVGSRAVA